MLSVCVFICLCVLVPVKVCVYVCVCVSVTCFLPRMAERSGREQLMTRTTTQFTMIVVTRVFFLRGINHLKSRELSTDTAHIS